MENNIRDSFSFYKVNVGTCICDGNKAQKKAFSFTWSSSLRFKDKWLKAIIFIPCLCHRIDNAYKYHATHDESIKIIVDKIKEYPQILNEHRDEIGAKCPPSISTRWIYDFVILDFIIKNKDKTSEYVVISEDELQLYDILFIFKSLISIFENPNTPFHRAFFYLERGIKALEELNENGNSYANGFRESLLSYTLQSEEGGLWILGYLFTLPGQRDIREMIRRCSLSYPGEGLSFFQKRKQKKNDDPIKQYIDEAVDEYEQNQLYNEKAKESELEPQDLEEEETDDIFNALQIAAFGQVEKETTEDNKDDVPDQFEGSILDAAKTSLKEILKTMNNIMKSLSVLC